MDDPHFITFPCFCAFSIQQPCCGFTRSVNPHPPHADGGRFLGFKSLHNSHWSHATCGREGVAAPCEPFPLTPNHHLLTHFVDVVHTFPRFWRSFVHFCASLRTFSQHVALHPPPTFVKSLTHTGAPLCNFPFRKARPIVGVGNS